MSKAKIAALTFLAGGWMTALGCSVLPFRFPLSLNSLLDNLGLGNLNLGNLFGG